MHTNKSWLYNDTVLQKICLLLFIAVFSGCSSSILSRDSNSGSQMDEEFQERVTVSELKPKPKEAELVEEEKLPRVPEDQDELKKTLKKLKKQKKLREKEEKEEKAEQRRAKKGNKSPSKHSKKQEQSAKKGQEQEPKKESLQLNEDPLWTGYRKRHEPDIEDGTGFNGRRPIVDPFRVGERIRLKVTYLGVAAGFLTLETGPFVEVNGRKHYDFKMRLDSSDVFSLFYKVRDKASTYVDYETMLPTTFKLDVKETGQLRDTKAFFDQEKLEAYMWEKKYTKSKGEQIRKLEWEMEPFSQNVFSAINYMRVFQYEVGKDYAFRVADNGKNLVFKGKVIRKEKLKTGAGTFNTIVIKPDVSVGGVLTPTGDIFFWLTDDDRKFLVKIQSKIKIGTINAYLDKIEYGVDP